MKKLMVFITDSLSDLVRKGEITDRYYNPGDLFDEVHLWMTNDDRPDPATLQKTVGKARLYLYNLPYSRRLFLGSLGFRPWRLESWARPAVASAVKIRPDLIRCHGHFLNGILAYFINKRLGVPYVVSLHINPDENPVMGGGKGRLFRLAKASMEKLVLRGANRVLPVYQPIVPYLQRLGVRNFEVAYNVVNPAHLKKKDDYRLHNPVRVVSVGRQLREKNPENIIRAIRRLPEVRLTLVGDGPIHDPLVALTRDCGVEDRVEFLRAVPNDTLSANLQEYDIFAVHTEYWEISKSVLEPLLTGLPVIVNRRVGRPVPEFEGGFMVLVKNTEDAYHDALKNLIENHEFRETLGRKAYEHVKKRWSPAETEANFVRIYKEVMGGPGEPAPEASLLKFTAGNQ